MQDGPEPNQLRHEPMVAMICPEKQGDKLSRLFHNQFMNAEGKWTTDFDHKATCKQDKVDIMEYCKKVSPTFYNLESLETVLKNLGKLEI